MGTTEQDKGMYGNQKTNLVDMFLHIFESADSFNVLKSLEERICSYDETLLDETIPPYTNFSGALTSLREACREHPDAINNYEAYTRCYDRIKETISTYIAEMWQREGLQERVAGFYRQLPAAIQQTVRIREQIEQWKPDALVEFEPHIQPPAVADAVTYTPELAAEPIIPEKAEELPVNLVASEQTEESAVEEPLTQATVPTTVISVPLREKHGHTDISSSQHYSQYPKHHPSWVAQQLERMTVPPRYKLLHAALIHGARTAVVATARLFTSGKLDNLYPTALESRPKEKQYLLEVGQFFSQGGYFTGHSQVSSPRAVQ